MPSMSMTLEDCSISRPGRPMPNITDKILEQFKMPGHVSIVTGGSRGIGFAVAGALAEAGSHVVLVHGSANPVVAQEAENLGQRYSVKVMAIQCNVTDFADVSNLISVVIEEFGKIDVFVANAGICIPKPILEQTLEDYHRQVDVNLHGVVYCAMQVGPVFQKQGYGNFIITSSVSGQVVTVPVDHTAYNTTKAAVTHFGRSIAREWRLFARVNMVSPGYVDTAMSDIPEAVNEAHRMSVLGRQAHVKELKALYLYLASGASSFVTGANYVIDGGYTLP